MEKVMKKILDFVDKVAKRKSEYKQVILIREDLHLPKGKMAAQAAHASVTALMKSEDDERNDIVDAWKREGMKKVVLRVKDIRELMDYKKRAEQKGLSCALVTDAGRTIIKSGTVTCLGIGPDDEKKIDEVCGELRVY